MGNVNAIPVVSQVKSGVQLICNDAEGAKNTQINFLQECPVVSQITSTAQLITGDVNGAIETQKKCGKGLLNMADGIPAVGHVKGVIHYALGDREGGDKAMKCASRTSSVIAGGAGGFLIGGTIGSVAGGISGGATFDSAYTIADSAVSGEFRPSGYIAGVNNAINNPNPGDIFALAVMSVVDGLENQ